MREGFCVVQLPAMWIRFATFWLATLGFSVTCSQLNAAEGDDLHYTLYRTWALALAESENAFKIVAFLPEAYLFRVLQPDTEQLSGNNYSQVITQDGVEVLLYSDAISDWTFRQAVGSHEIIFNSPYRLCKTPACDKILEEQVWQIARGEAFKITGDDLDYSDMVQISATRGNAILRGYIPREELETLSQNGIITRTDRRVPRYAFQRYKSDTLGTQCGEQIESGEIRPLIEGDRHSKDLAQLLKMGKPAGDGIEIQKSYGGEGYQYSFYLYEVEDQAWEAESPERYFQMAAGFKTRCMPLGNSGQSVETFIEHVVFVNSRNRINGEPVQVDIPSGLFGTPQDLLQYTNDAYMISINKPEHFERAIEILTRKIGDRTLAGYVLTELNRSCRSELRVQYSGSVCRIYDY
ncbi:MAG: hypothetical protein RLN82_07955 [Pseudomonadales bacterium]